MTPSQWIVERIVASSPRFPSVWVEDPYCLLEPGDAKEACQTLQQRGVSCVIADNALRLYERLAACDPSTQKVVVIDQSCSPRQPHALPQDCRPSDFRPILAPAWKHRLPPEAIFRPSVREFLLACTDDPRWPPEVDLYPFETLARRQPARFAEAFSTFVRSGRPPTRGDLLMIGASTIFDSDLAEISRPITALELAFHSAEKWDELATYFNSLEMDEIRQRLTALPSPMGDLFAEGNDTARLAVVASIVLRQHMENPGKHLAVLDPGLKRFSNFEFGAEPSVPAWFLEDEVRRFEARVSSDFLRYLYDQLDLSNDEKRGTFARSERLSPKLRGLVPFEIPVPDSTRMEVREHLGRFSIPNLVGRFMRARNLLHRITTQAKPAVERLRLTPPKDITVAQIQKVFVDGELHLVDQLVSEVQSAKADIDGPAKPDWGHLPGFEERWRQEWTDAASLAENATRTAADLDHIFGRLVEARYSDLTPAQMLSTDMFYESFVYPRRRTVGGQVKKAVILMVDSLRFDLWRQLLRPFLERLYEIEECAGLARLPSETDVSRRAFFAGLPPGAVPAGAETDLFAALVQRVHGAAATWSPGSRRDGMAFAVKSDEARTYACVFDFADRLSHRVDWDPVTIQESLHAILHNIEAVLRENGKDTLVFLAADHGHMRVQRGTGVRIQSLDVGHRAAYVDKRLEGRDAIHVFQIAADVLGHKQPGVYIFPKPGYYLVPSDRGRGAGRSYHHGGISLFEMMVPFVCMRHRQAATRISLSGVFRQKPVVGQPAEIEVTVAADNAVASPVRVAGDTEEILATVIPQMSTVPSKIVLRFTPSAPGPREIRLTAFMGANEVGEVKINVDVQTAPKREAPDAARTKLQKIFGDMPA